MLALGGELDDGVAAGIANLDAPGQGSSSGEQVRQLPSGGAEVARGLDVPADVARRVADFFAFLAFFAIGLIGWDSEFALPPLFLIVATGLNLRPEARHHLGWPKVLSSFLRNFRPGPLS